MALSAQRVVKQLPRWRREDWVAWGAECLRIGGPEAMTLEHLCARAGRTKGSFYHHFDTTEEFVVAVAEHWRQSETDGVARLVFEVSGARDSLKRLAQLSVAIDHRLELGVRALAVGSSAVAKIVREADRERENILTTLLSRGYGLNQEQARNAARLFHALHLAAQMRSPEDIRAFSDGPTRMLLRWIRAT